MPNFEDYHIAIVLSENGEWRAIVFLQPRVVLTSNAASLSLQVEVESILYWIRLSARLLLMSSLVTRTLKLRIKDRHAALLQRMATQVNQVWNFCNETSSRSIQERHTWLR